jgi:hypothetical protein
VVATCWRLRTGRLQNQNRTHHIPTRNSIKRETAPNGPDEDGASVQHCVAFPRIQIGGSPQITGSTLQSARTMSAALGLKACQPTHNLSSFSYRRLRTHIDQTRPGSRCLHQSLRPPDTHPSMNGHKTPPVRPRPPSRTFPAVGSRPQPTLDAVLIAHLCSLQIVPWVRRSKT